MDPGNTMVTPAMEIATKCAVSKGVLKVRTPEEADELISQIIIAKTGLLGAASAIGAQGAMDAACEVEAERAGREAEQAARHYPCCQHCVPACRYADAHEVPCMDCQAAPEPGTQAYADKYASREVQRELLGLAVPDPGPAACAQGSCPGHGLPCAIPGAHDLPHRCARGCEFDAEDKAPAPLAVIPLSGAFPEPLPAEPEPVPLTEALERVRPMEPRDMRGALVTIGQYHPGVFNEVVPVSGPACPCCTAAPFTVNDCNCREDCGVTQCQAADPDPDPPGDGRCPDCSVTPGDEHLSGCDVKFRLRSLGAKVHELSVPATSARAGRHEMRVAR